MKIKIYRQDDTILTEVTVLEDSVISNEIRGEHTLSLSFSITEYVEIPEGAYVILNGTTYTLLSQSRVTMNNTRSNEVTAVFEAAQAMLSSIRMRNPDDGTLSFPYTATAGDHLALIIANLNRYSNSNEWTVGECVDDGTVKFLQYDYVSCLDALNSIADIFGTEWEISGTTVSLHKVEYNISSPLELEYGKMKGLRPGIARETAARPLTRIYTQGGSRNIDVSQYGSAILLLPKSATFKYDGSKFEDEAGFDSDKARTYTTDSGGTYISSAKNASRLVNEGVIDCTDIYPSATHSVIGFDYGETVPSWVTLNVPENLDYSQYVILGELPTVTFQNGNLQGKTFEIRRNQDGSLAISKEYTELGAFVGWKFMIASVIENGMRLPDLQSGMVPENGDTCRVFGVQLPAEYICDNENKTGASWDMLRRGITYLYEYEDSIFSLKVEIDPIWARTNWDYAVQKFRIGGYVKYINSSWAQGGVMLRIQSIRQGVSNPYSIEIELGNGIVGGGILKGLEDKISRQAGSLSEQENSQKTLEYNVSNIGGNFVTLDTEQTITAKKTFAGDVVLGGQRQDGSYGRAFVPSHAGPGVYDLYISNAPIAGEAPSGGSGGIDETELWSILGASGTQQIDASHMSNALAGYATQLWVEGRGYLTSSALTPYATKEWVEQQGYLTEDDLGSLEGYVTLDTAQTVTGAKTFSALLTASGGISGSNADLTGYLSAAKLYVPSYNGNKVYDLYVSDEPIAGEAPSGSGGLDEAELWSILTDGGSGERIVRAHLPLDVVYEEDLSGFLTSVSLSTISDLNAGWDGLLKAAPDYYSKAEVGELLEGYVTLATAQTVSGKKTFTALLTASGGISGSNADLAGYLSAAKLYVPSYNGNKVYDLYVSNEPIAGEAPSEGGGGLDEAELWAILGDDGTEKISAGHLPALSSLSGSLDIGRVSGLGSGWADVLDAAVPSWIVSVQSSGTGNAYTSHAIAGGVLTLVKGATFLTSVPQATDSSYGGFRTGYSGVSARNYSVQLDSSGRAYVYVPWNNTTYTLSSFGITATADEINKLDGAGTLIHSGNYTSYSYPTTIALISGLHSSWDALLKASPSAYVTRWPSFSEVSGRPTTIDGYGITDAYTKAEIHDMLDGYVTLSTVQTVSGKKTFTALLTASDGVQIGDASDYGWYIGTGTRISAGISAARGVNVGNLLVSNLWADYTKVPTNGIYSKGDIWTGGRLYVPSFQGNNVYDLYISNAPVAGETPSGSSGIDEAELWSILTDNAGGERIAKAHLPLDTVYDADLDGYITSVSLATISDLNSGWDALLKAAPSAYVTRWPTAAEVGALTQGAADGRYAYKGGSNATGTWPISVSGNAASATKAGYITPRQFGNQGTVGALKSSILSAMGDGNLLMYPGQSYITSGSNVATIMNNWSNDGFSIPAGSQTMLLRLDNYQSSTYGVFLVSGYLGSFYRLLREDSSTWAGPYTLLDTGNYTSHLDGRYLLKSTYTAADVLAKIKTVDGAGSGLDADLLDGVQLTSLASAHHYLTNAGRTTGYYKILINSTAPWMLYFRIRLYQSYNYYDIDISGYNYHSEETNYSWYMPKAKLVSSNVDSVKVYFGHDSANKLWVAVPAQQYTGLAIYDVVNGYYEISKFNAFTISYVSSLSGTTDSTQTCYRGASINDNVASATKLQTSRTLWGRPFDGMENVSGDMTGVGSFTGVGWFKYGASDESDAAYGKYHRLNLGYHGIDHTDFYEQVFNFYSNGGGTTWAKIGSTNYFNGNVGIGTTSPAYKLDVAGTLRATSITASGLVKAGGGVQVGNMADYGWYIGTGTRISAGISAARGVNVGNLLVSNLWADYTKVPANGIYSKGDIWTGGRLYVPSYSGNQVYDLYISNAPVSGEAPSGIDETELWDILSDGGSGERIAKAHMPSDVLYTDDIQPLWYGRISSTGATAKRGGTGTIEVSRYATGRYRITGAPNTATVIAVPLSYTVGSDVSTTPQRSSIVVTRTSQFFEVNVYNMSDSYYNSYFYLLILS